MIDWSHLRSFLAVMRGGSLSEAARRLGLTQPTIRRHIEALEEDTGQTLFLRSPSGLQPNANARALLTSAEAVEAGVHLFERQASAPAATIAGTVRITASQIIAVEVLPVILGGIHQMHPRLCFELDSSDDARDVLRNEADIAVRMVRPVQQDLLAQRVATVRLGLFAHRRWLDNHQRPATMADLHTSGSLLGYDRDAVQERAWQNYGGSPPPTAFAVRSDDQVALLAALRHGVGIGICQLPIAERDPALTRVLPNVELNLPIWLVTHEGLRKDPRVAAVYEALIGGLQAYAQPS